MDTRKRTRLAGFDYASQGAYFVTVCARRRGTVFGDVHDGAVCLNARGLVVAEALDAIPDRHEVRLDASLVMPDHVHAIVVLRRGRETLSAVVGSFKARVTRRLRRSVWQRGFYDHVIRDEADLERVREYIETNPARWSLETRGMDAGRTGPAPTATDPPSGPR
jgi:REP element-mobilizing transposase RayT